jgi:hypothetical protein
MDDEQRDAMELNRLDLEMMLEAGEPVDAEPGIVVTSRNTVVDGVEVRVSGVRLSSSAS